MKLSGRRIHKGDIVLFLGMLAVTVCTIMISAAQRANYLNSLRSRSFYTEKARKFSVTECEDIHFWKDIFPECPDDFILYHQIVDEETDIRAVYLKGNAELPQMIWGRFFQETDQFQSIPTAVIGQELEEKIVWEGDQGYYSYDGQLYQVLGVMGYEWESCLDHMVYIDFASGLLQQSSNGKYVLDANRVSVIEQCMQVLNKSISESGRINVSVQDSEDGVLTQYLEGGTGIVIYLLMYISFLISVIIIASMWLGYRERTIGITQLLGFTDREIFRIVGKHFLNVSLLAWFLGASMGFGIAGNSEIIDLLWMDFLFSFSVTLFSGIIALYFPFSKCIKKEIYVKTR